MKKMYLFSLLVVLTSALQAQKMPPVIEWHKYLGGSKVDKANTVIPTSDHGYLVVGFSFSNDGQVTGHHGSTDSSDAWVVKLNASGDIEWQRSYGGSNKDEFKHAIQVGNGDFICVGSTRSMDGDVSGLHADSGVVSDLWVMRIDRLGAIKWSKVFGGSRDENGQVIRKMADGNYMIGGNAMSTDYDVTVNQGGYDMWILKINEQGNLLWQKSYGNPNSQLVTSITVTSDNNYVISGYQLYRRYPTPDPFLPPVYSIYEEAAIKIDGQGNSIWTYFPFFRTGNPGPSHFISRIVELPSRQLLSVGAYAVASNNTMSWNINRFDNNNGTILKTYGVSATLDAPYTLMDAGPEMAQVLSDSSILACFGGSAGLIRFGSNTPFSSLPLHYRTLYGTTGDKLFNGVIALTDDEYIMGGYSNAYGVGGTGSHGDYDAWVVKTRAMNTIKGKVFLDQNANGIKDVNEPYFTHGSVESKKNESTIRSSISPSGVFENKVDSGTYTTTLKLNSSTYYTVSPASRNSTFTVFNGKDSFDFVVTPLPDKKDLQVSLQPLSVLRAGFKGQYRLTYANAGTVPISNAVIKLELPSVMNYVSAIPAASVTVDTLTWNLGNLDPMDSSSIYLELRSDLPPVVNLDTVLLFTATIYPVTGDETPGNNKDTLYQRVRGSYDPNDKTENNNGHFYISQLQTGGPLTYTIRFQNTGNDTAFNIVIRDTLSTKLDLSSIEMIGASHLYQLSIKDSIYCTWTFNNILLPDSNINEPASHGYLSYRIKPKSNLQIGDTIYNAASIYFDFNLPVKTNTFVTVITPDPIPAPPQPIISGLVPAYCSSVGTTKGKILNLPVSGNTTVTVKLDAAVLPVVADSSFTITLSSLTGGMHTITVTYSNATDTKTTTANFTLTAAVTPNVNVTANITTVINLSNQVIITAVNAAGGGKNPLYTFAWDRNFTNLLQTEGANTTVTVPAASFAMGDNKMYVRMKSSEDCYTTQTNIDSITIRRDAATGIVDVEFPGQVINIYPNPFNGPVTVDGLQTGKTYLLLMYNVHGQLVQSKRVANRSTTQINRLKDASGIFWLSVYDEKKKRLLGSVRLIKQ